MVSSEYPSLAVNRVIDDALKAHRASKAAGHRRHPADVTADRLGEATQKYDFTSAERDAIATVIDALRKIAG